MDEADSLADEFPFETEVVESNVADPTTESVEIDSYKIDHDHVDGFHYEVDSDNVISNLIV